MISIQETAIRVSLTITKWGVSKRDDEVTSKAIAEAEATADAGNFNKRLLAKRYTENIDRIANEARKLFRESTLPWGKKDRILPMAMLEDFRLKIKAIKREYFQAVGTLALVFPSAVAERASELGAMHNPNEYPSVDDLQKAYTFELDVANIEDANDLRVAVSKEAADEIAKEIRRGVQLRIDSAVEDLFGRAQAVIGRMVSSLTEDKRFSATMVSGIEDLADLLPRLNVLGDQKLENLAQRMKRELCQYTVEDIRKNPAVKQTVLDRAKALQENVNLMANFMDEVDIQKAA
ncbi:MAG: hypothetical protein ABIL58_27115 [Pseudomonadota bacterium]